MLGPRLDHAHACGGLVHEIDGLVGQLALGDVPVRVRDGGEERGVGDLVWCGDSRGV